jgi:hypothetical protein
MRGPVFEQARTAAGFGAVSVDAETGTVVWPGSADLAPDTLYERLRTGPWPDEPRRSDSRDVPTQQKAPQCGAFHSAPERTRSSTDHSVHKALNPNPLI